MMMIQRLRGATLSLAAAAVLGLAGQVFAQNASAPSVPESHVKAARAALAAIHATDNYDNILPQAAQALKADLIRQNPDIEALVTSTVDEKAIALASRRADLEREAALLYARSFTEPELNDIANFYNSAAGKKLLSEGPVVSRELVKAVNIWQNGVARDLAREVGSHINQVMSAKAAEKKPATPATGAAPGAAPAAPAPKP